MHRGGEVTLDVSADLNELGRTPVAIVCAGVKSILDIGRTLEYLETQGILCACFSLSLSFFLSLRMCEDLGFDRITIPCKLE